MIPVWILDQLLSKMFFNYRTKFILRLLKAMFLVYSTNVGNGIHECPRFNS